MALFSSSHITNQAQEDRIFKVRLQFIIFFLLCTFTLILGRVFYLQFVNYQEQVERSDGYHLRFRAIPPERGLIYDYSGKVLAGNRLSYALYIHPLKLKSVEDLVTNLGSVIKLEEEGLAYFYKEIKDHRRRNQLVLLRERLTEQEISRLMVNRYKFPGIEIRPQFQRFYPQGVMLSHLIGHIGRISEEDQDRIDESDYRGLNIIGKLGLESFYELDLKGTQGLEEIGVNAYGKVVEVYRKEEPLKGKDISLWLDTEIQRYVWDAMEDNKGAVIILDAATGGILSMVSKPSYDNNLFVKGISHNEFEQLRLNQDAPLLNRASSGRYPPGSTIKPFYAIIALSNGVVTPRFSINDPGWFRLPNSDLVFRNWKRSGHGKVNLRRAIRVSSDTYFYTLANKMGYDLMHAGLEDFGFGYRGTHDVYSEYKEPLPTNQWKITHHNLPWFPGDTVNMGIGQGYLLVSPIQLAAATLVLVNRGKNIKPRVVKEIDGQAAYLSHNENIVVADDSHWELVFEGMKDVVHDKEGTAKIAGEGAGYLIAGKTGTSQVISLDVIEEAQRSGKEIKKEWRDHASYTGFVPADKPKYIITVLLENGGSGVNAALLARRITDYLMFEHDKVGLKD